MSEQMPIFVQPVGVALGKQTNLLLSYLSSRMIHAILGAFLAR
jgi:hypothetical protein